MRVLFFTTSGSYYGGGVMCLMEMLGNLDRSIYEPYVVIPTHGTTEDILKKLNIPYQVIRTYDWLVPRDYLHTVDCIIKYPIRRLINLMAELRFLWFMRKHKIDIFHINSIYNKTGFGAARLLNIPVAWHIREYAHFGNTTPVFYNEDKAYRTMEKATVLISVSDCVKKYFQSKMPVANIETIYDGVALPERTEKISFLTGPWLRLTMVGGITPVKGHTDAIKAVKILTDRGIRCKLSIVGRVRDKVYYQELEKLIQENELDDLVIFTGNRTDMENVWSDTDILLVCSRSESFGRVTIEAMNQGLPVIGADNTGTEELIKESVCGSLYSTGNEESLAEEIMQLLRDENTKSSRIGNVDYAKKYAIKNNVKNFEILLDRLFEKRLHKL